jgi:hypothetical protein
MSQQLSSKPGVSSLLCTLVCWTVAFFSLPLAAFFGGRSSGLSDNAAAIAAVGTVQLVLLAFAVFAYQMNFSDEAKKD